MRYVLLLRGINVGGRNKIVMAIFSLIQPRVEGKLLPILKLFSQKDTPLWSNLLC